MHSLTCRCLVVWIDELQIDQVFPTASWWYWWSWNTRCYHGEYNDLDRVSLSCFVPISDSNCKESLGLICGVSPPKHAIMGLWCPGRSRCCASRSVMNQASKPESSSALACALDPLGPCTTTWHVISKMLLCLLLAKWLSTLSSRGFSKCSFFTDFVMVLAQPGYPNVTCHCVFFDISYIVVSIGIG